MKKPEEIKKDIIDCMEEAIEVGQTCDAKDLLGFSDKAYVCMATTRAYIQQLEAANAEKDKRIAELEQELAAVKWERDAAVEDIRRGSRCSACKKFFKNNDGAGCSGGVYCIPLNFEWRGVCPENSSDERSCSNCKHQGADGRGICMDCGMDYRKWEPLETEVQPNA